MRIASGPQVDLVDLDRRARAHGRPHRVDRQADADGWRRAADVDVLGSLAGQPRRRREVAQRRDGHAEPKAGRVDRGLHQLVGVSSDVVDGGVQELSGIEHRIAEASTLFVHAISAVPVRLARPVPSLQPEGRRARGREVGTACCGGRCGGCSWQ